MNAVVMHGFGSPDVLVLEAVETPEPAPGDEVFAATAFRFGGAAEYVRLPESYPIARIPDTMTVEEGAVRVVVTVA